MDTDQSGAIFVTFNNKATTQRNNENVETPADFETAITETGFGKFNFILFLIGIPSSLSTMLDTTIMSYVLPVAQCDLDLSLDNKGMLNAITYIGMMTSGIIWGYLADTTGRKKMLMVGFLLNAFFGIISGFSQFYSMLVVSKFMTGFMLSGPYAILISYMNEFHSAKYRVYVPFLNGIIYSIAGVTLPLLAWSIFSYQLNVFLLDESIVLHSWNVFILVCSIPALIAGIGYLFLPESPKFLMSAGKNEAAMKVFRNIYACNSGKSADTFPINTLLEERKPQKSEDSNANNEVARSNIQIFKESGRQVLKLFYPPYLGNMLLAFTIQFCIMMGLNTLRLWLPQLFTAINDYTNSHKDEDANMCKIIESIDSRPSISNGTCFVNYDNLSIYTNNVIVGFVSLIIYLSAIVVVRKISKKFVLIGASLCAGISGITLILCKSEIVIIVLSSIYVGMFGICVNLIASIVVDMFPTGLRTLTMSLTMIFGRLGAITGNLVFPELLEAGCLPPLLTVGCLAFGCSLLSAMLPKTDKDALK